MPSTSKGIPVHQQLDDLVTELALLIAAAHRVPSVGPAPQDEARAYTLAVIEACTSFTQLLNQRADEAMRHARDSHASYTEIGARRGITRQAARQALLRHRLQEEDEQRARRERHERCLATDPDAWDDWHDGQEHIRQQREERWPPRAWRYRAPTGLRTVSLVDGPAADHTFRVPTGDDAFPFIDHYEVFGRRHDRYARYTAVSPASDQYRFTGEYFVRWT